MSAVGPLVFGALLWGSLLGVFCVFCFEAYAVARGTVRLRRRDRT